MTRTIGLAAALAALSAAAGGCILVEKKEHDKLVSMTEEQRREIQRLRDTNDALQRVIVNQTKQIETLQALGPGRLAKLYHVRAITLGRYTGGIDTDGRSGHDAVKVYLRPIDQDGSTIKAAGDVKIQLFDLAEPADKNLIGQYTWTADKLSGQWSGSFMTYHYSFVCPWQSGAPKHEEITVRVRFTDYLTGKTHAAQTVCKVKPPAKAAAGG